MACNVDPPPARRRRQLQEFCQIRQLLNLGEHDGVLGDVVLAGRLVGKPIVSTERLRNFSADYFAFTDELRGKAGGVPVSQSRDAANSVGRPTAL